MLEGIDGTGKSTLARSLAAHLTTHGHTVILSREPTDGPWGKKLRDSATTGRLTPQEELDCFLNDRRDHVQNLILPTLQKGHTIILDRYYFSTMAYQGARGFDPKQIRKDNEAFAPPPHILIILDLDIPTALQRIGARGDTANQFEQTEALRKCRDIFLTLQHEPFAHIINASSPPEKILTQALQIISKKTQSTTST